MTNMRSVLGFFSVAVFFTFCTPGQSANLDYPADIEIPPRITLAPTTCPYILAAQGEVTALGSLFTDFAQRAWQTSDRIYRSIANDALGDYSSLFHDRLTFSTLHNKYSAILAGRKLQDLPGIQRARAEEILVTAKELIQRNPNWIPSSQAILGAWFFDGNLERLNLNMTMFPPKSEATWDSLFNDLKDARRLSVIVSRELAADAFEALARLPHLDSLALYSYTQGPEFDDIIRALVRSRLAPKLKKLFLEASIQGDSSLEILAMPDRLKNLTHLAFSSGQVTEAGFQTLAQSPQFSHLTSLSFFSTMLPVAAIQNLARSATLSGLTEFVADKSLTTEGLEALAASPTWRSLTKLDLRNNRVQSRAITALMNSPLMDTVTDLNLSYNDLLRQEAVTAIGASEHLGALRLLDLSYSNLHGEGARELANAKALQRLRKLSVRRSDLGNEGFKSLTASPVLKDLEILEVQSNDINATREAGLSWALPGLRRLSLGMNPIGDEGIGYLVQLGALRQIRDLRLGLVGLTPLGASHLTSLSSLESLELGVEWTPGHEATPKQLGQYWEPILNHLATAKRMGKLVYVGYSNDHYRIQVPPSHALLQAKLRANRAKVVE